jgi:release factor glutamine methyltransferase
MQSGRTCAWVVRPLALRSTQTAFLSQSTRQQQPHSLPSVGQTSRSLATGIQPRLSRFSSSNLIQRYSTTSNRDEYEPHTVGHVLHSAVADLQAAQIDEAADSVFHIFAHVLDLPWDRGFRDLREIYSQENRLLEASLAQQRVSTEEMSRLGALLERRKTHEPIQYLVGKWDFLDHVFEVTSPLLCPRPETEELVLYAAALAQQTSCRRILDVGCGTGCIGISLAARLPEASVVALDVEATAVQVAERNARAILGSNDRYQVHLTAAESFEISPDQDLFDLVVSNPPYIPASDMDGLDPVVAQWESHTALCGGPDGLDVVRTIVRQLPRWCRKGADCWMEVDPTHPALIQQWVEQSEGDLGVVFVKAVEDLQGRARFVHLRVQED